jgi:hypothetical protein
VKSLLNRRSAVLTTGPSHLVQMAHDSATTSHDALNASPAAIAAAPAAASSETVENTRPVTTLRPVPVVPSPPTGRAIQIADTAEVEWLAEEEALTPFRVFRSFDYSVSLLFHARELAYYVALYQEGALWRALKAADLDAAEAAFHHFEEQATRLSEGETRRAQLAAQNEQLAQAVTGRQHQVRKEVSQLEAQRVAAQAQLNKAHRQIHQLNLTSNEGVPHLHGR